MGGSHKAGTGFTSTGQGAKVRLQWPHDFKMVSYPSVNTIDPTDQAISADQDADRQGE